MVKENGIKSGQVKRVLRRGNSKGSTTNGLQEPKVKLEQILGISATSNNSLSYNPNTENILYTAGCVCVLYNLKKSKQTFIKNDSKKPLTCAAFSSDGTLVVTGESGHKPCVRVWEASSGDQLKALQGHSFGISSVSFSPNTKAVVSVGFTHDSTVCVWNWKSGKQVASNKTSSRVFGMSFSEKGTYFVTVGIRFVKFWYFDTNDDKALNQLTPCGNRGAILEEHKNTTFKSVVCGKGKFSHLTFCLSNEGSLFSFGESRRVERWLNLKVNDAFALYVTQDHLLCGCSDGVVRVFEPSSLSHIVNLPKPHPLGVDLAACTSPSSLISVHSSPEFPDCIGVVADSLTNKVIVLYRDKSLYVWDISNINMIGKHRSYLFHSACVCAIEVYPQEAEEKMCLPKGTFITGSSDNTIKIWNLSVLDQEEKIKRNVYSKELLNQFYTDRDFSWMRGRRGNAVGDNASGVTALAVSPKGDIVASGDKNGNLRVHELIDLSGHELAVIEAHDAEVLALTFTHPDSCWHYLASASRDRLIHVFDIRNDYSLLQTIDDHSAIVTSVKFVDRPNDSQLTLLSTSADKSVRFRTAAKSGQSLQFSTYQHVQEKSTFNDMEIPQTKDKVITGCQDRQIRTYELSSGKLVGSFKSGSSEDSGMIVNVALDPSNTYLAAAGSDKCIFVHDVNSGERLASLYGHSEMITGLKFTNDCKRLISISGDGCIFVWRIGNEVVKNIRHKMKGQGFEPEIGVNTPDRWNTSAKISSPPNEFTVPILELLAKQSEVKAEEMIVEEIRAEEELPTPVPDFSVSDRLTTTPSTTSLRDNPTPENKRRKWGVPSANTHIVLENMSIEPETPVQFSKTTRTSPEGRDKSEPPVAKVSTSTSESDKSCNQVETAMHVTEDRQPTARLSDEDRQPTARVSDEDRQPTARVSDEDRQPTTTVSDEDNTGDEAGSDEQLLYLPPPIRSPNVKRLSHVFDVNVTPLHAGKTNGPDLASDEEEEAAFNEEDDVEDDLKSDSFLLHKFAEISDECDVPSQDEQEESFIRSPESRNRQSMSRKFYTTTSPDNLKSTSPDSAKTDDTPHHVQETPRSKGPSPKVPTTLFGQDEKHGHSVVNRSRSPSGPDKDAARQAIADKIAAKKKEKDGSKKKSTKLIRKKSLTFENGVTIAEEGADVGTDREFAFVPPQPVRNVFNDSFRRRSNLGISHSLNLDLEVAQLSKRTKESSSSFEPISTEVTTSMSSLSDPSKSDYQSAHSKNTASDFDSGNDKNEGKKQHKSDKKTEVPSKQKSKAKPMALNLFGSKTKDDKNVVKKESKNGLKKEDKSNMKKEEKQEKANKKSKGTALTRKESSSSNESLMALKTAFRSSITRYDVVSTEKPSTRRTQALGRMAGVFREMMGELQLRLDTPPNLASVNGHENGGSAEQHAAKCAELCAEKILQLVNEKLQFNELRGNP